MTEKEHYGHFKAKYLWPLADPVNYARASRFTNQLGHCCIFVEPADIGGVYISATTGHTIAVIHDPDGFATGPVTLDIPDAAFIAAKGPKSTEMTFEGNTYRPKLPEWMQPDDVWFSDSEIFITTKMRNPEWADMHEHFYPALYQRIASGKCDHTVGLDYRLIDGIRYGWRDVLGRAFAQQEAETDRLCVNPDIPNLFMPILEMFANDPARQPYADPIGMIHSLRYSRGFHTAIVQITNHPEFIGVWIGYKDTPPDPIPSHFLEIAQKAGA